MKNISSLLARLSVLSLAAAVAFSTVQAAPNKKDPKAAAAMIEALVKQTAGSQDRAVIAVTAPAPVPTPTPPPGPTTSNLAGTAGTEALIITTPLVVGKADGSHNNVVVYGQVMADGDLIGGELGEVQTKGTGAATHPVRDGNGNLLFKSYGKKHLIGIAALDPRTQQFRVVFKDKSATALGAFIDLDFVTTATGIRIDTANASGKKAVVGVNWHGIYAHPQLTAAQMAGSTVAGSAPAGGEFTASGGHDYSADAGATNVGVQADDAAVTPFILNGYASSASGDLEWLGLTGIVRKDSVTSNVNFGFVPPYGEYKAATGDKDGFYDSGWGSAKDFYGPQYDTGVLSYQVAGSNLVSCGVVDAVSDENIIPADIYDIFTEEDLALIFESLSEYFGNNSAKMRDYLVTHRNQLSRILRSAR